MRGTGIREFATGEVGEGWGVVLGGERSWGKHGAVSSLCWMEWEWEISREPSIHYFTFYSFSTIPLHLLSSISINSSLISNHTERCFLLFSLLWEKTRACVWVQRATAECHGAGPGFFLHHQHSCIGYGRDASQRFLQHKELRWPCSWLLLILLLESAALTGLQPHFYWKSFAVIKPFSLWLGYCSHKSSSWPLGNSLMFVLLQCYL